MCTNNPEIQTSTGPRTIDNLGQTLNVLSVPSMQCLINAINIQRQASSQGASKTTFTGQKGLNSGLSTKYGSGVSTEQAYPADKRYAAPSVRLLTARLWGMF